MQTLDLQKMDLMPMSDGEMMYTDGGNFWSVVVGAVIGAVVGFLIAGPIGAIELGILGAMGGLSYEAMNGNDRVVVSYN